MDISGLARFRGMDLRARPLLIVSPAAGDYPRLADRLRRSLGRATGQDIQVVGDDVTASAVGDANLVVPGNLMDSDFVRNLYFSWFDWTDGAWPSPGGWVLRTIVDPWGTGAHVVLAGGSDAGGVEAAADALVWTVEKDRTWLPLLHEVHLGAWADAYRQDLAPMLSPDFDWREAGGGGSGSWDFMMRVADAGKGFLFTGETRFLELYRDQLLRFFDTHWFNRKREEPVQIHGFIHHMLLPWELTEHHPVFSDDHRRRIFESFLHLYRSTEGAARPVFVNQVDRRQVRGNHDTRNALDLFFGGRYFRRVSRLPEAETWLRLAEAFLEPQANSSKPWEDSWGHQWVASLYNVAVYKAAAGDWSYFESRAFLDAADRAIIAHGNLRPGPINYFAIAAAATRNPEYLHPIRRLHAQGQASGGPGPKRPTAGRLGGDEVGRAFWTGDDAVEPRRLLGVAVAPLDRLYHETARDRDGGYAGIATEDVPCEKGFDKISFREGFDARDQYLLLDGISGGGHSYQDANCIVSFEALGKTWINAFATGGKPASVREQNGVNIVRDGQGPGLEPRFASLHDVGDFGEWGSSGSSMLGLRGASWHRHILWRRGVYFLVVDEVEAEEGGEFLIEPTWYIGGEVEAEERGVSSRQGEASRMTMRHTGSTWTETLRLPAGRRGAPEITRWRQRLRTPLRPGDRRALATAFRAVDGEMPGAIDLSRTPTGWRVTTPEGVAAFGLRGFAREQDLVEARAWTAGQDEVILWGCSWMACADLMLAAPVPVGVRISRSSPGTQAHGLRGTPGEAPSAGLEFWVRDEVEIRLKCLPGRLRLTRPGTGDGEGIWTDGQGSATLRLTPGRNRVELDVTPALETLRKRLGVAGAAPEARPDPPKFSLKRGRDLAARFETDLGAAVTALSVGDTGISAGTQEGSVVSLGRDGEEAWTYESGHPVRALMRLDLDGDGLEETVAGGNGETVHLLGSGGEARWAHRIVWQPMQWENWSQRDCKVLSFGAGDLNGDGRLELVAGCADRHCYALSLGGERLWRSPVQWGPMVCCAVADLDGDGRVEVMGGCAAPAIHGHCIVYRGDGTFDRAIARPDVRSWSVPSWMVALCVEDIDGDGFREILCGLDTNHRQLIVYRWPGQVVWDADLGGAVSAIATGGPDGDRAIYAGSSGGFLQAFTPGGNRRWWRFLGSPLAGVSALGDRVVAVTVPGEVSVFDPEGTLRQAFRIAAPARTVAAEGDLIVIGREDGRVHGFGVL